MDEFLDEFRNLKIGSKVKIKYESVQISTACAVRILSSGNVFTIKTIQEYENGILIGFEEVDDVFEYGDVILLDKKSKFIINWSRAS